MVLDPLTCLFLRNLGNCSGSLGIILKKGAGVAPVIERNSMKNRVAVSTVYRFSALALVTGLLLASGGCGNSSVFKSLSGGGATHGGLTGASQALDNGDYDSAIAQADSVIQAPGTSTEDLQSAYLLKGNGLLGASGFAATELAAVIVSGSDDNVLASFPTLETSVVTASAEAINTAFSLTNYLPPDPTFGTTNMILEDSEYYPDLSTFGISSIPGLRMIAAASAEST